MEEESQLNLSLQRVFPKWEMQMERQMNYRSIIGDRQFIEKAQVKHFLFYFMLAGVVFLKEPHRKTFELPSKWMQILENPW